MSGIYIPGMEMPTRCIACQLNYDSCACILTGTRFYKHGVDFDPGEEKLPDCPLIPVPDHGRLIDADALTAHFKEIADIEWNKKAAPLSWTYAFEDVMDDIANAPTIIPADKEGE